MQNAGVFVTGVGETDYAVCYPDRGLLTVKETSLSEQALTECLPALLKRFHCAEAVAIFPTTEDSFSHNLKPHWNDPPLVLFSDFTENGPSVYGINDGLIKRYTERWLRAFARINT